MTKRRSIDAYNIVQENWVYKIRFYNFSGLNPHTLSHYGLDSS